MTYPRMTAITLTRKTAALLMLPVLFLICLLVTGCLAAPPNTDWATPTTAASTAGAGDEIQNVLDTYGGAITAKDRNQLASVLDPQNPDFVRRQQEFLDRVQDVPFAQYQVRLVSRAGGAPGTITAKVDISYRFQGSFSALPEPRRAAFYLVKRQDGWKLSGDASQAALGKPSDAELWDLGTVRVVSGDHALVMYHPGSEDPATRVRDYLDAAYPRLVATLPGTNLPKVPVKVFDDKGQIDLAFPGKWQEWTGGASRDLGGSAGQGGEIIIAADLFQETASSVPGYNRKMVGHELTHVALFPLTGDNTPPFLLEGLADYVAGENTVSLLKDKLSGGGSFSPSLRDLYQPSGFDVLLNTDAAALAYEEADTAVAYLEKQYGNDKVLSLLQAFKKPDGAGSQDQRVDQAWRTVLGVSWDQFEQDWRNYVLSQ